jgi:NAD(P)-dependent dehydrogenase (short-subunit alcohol dehydrogenase family)
MTDYPALICLKGKTAFVTGGLGLIGKEVCRALCQAKAKTIILDINPAKGKKTAGELSRKGSAFYEDFDASKLENIETAMDALARKYGAPDIWVNCAYPRTADWGKKVEDLELDSWRENVDSHLNSYSWISRKACLLMKKKGGSLINYGSTYGMVGNDFTVYKGTGMTSPMAYAAIKGGVINLTRYLASYFGKYNVRVNNLCPGGVFDGQNPVFVKNYSEKTPLKRMAKPREIAAATLFLASDLSSYVTGTTLPVDGGWTAV